MQVTRAQNAQPYTAPRHHEVHGLRLQGYDATNTENFWVGLSYFLPGGGADRSATPFEKVYVVLDGEVTVTTDNDEQALGPMDSCVIPADEFRTIENKTNEVATMLVIMPYPPSPS
jgi:quercetin dioxygenase-like cupin family protein